MKESKPHFSGHETFPLRYGWLKKACDAVENTDERSKGKDIFKEEYAIAKFGVGKNMVSSMRHWAIAAGVVSEPSGPGPLEVSPLGKFLFGDAGGEPGQDPYLENPSSLWLLHWNLCNGGNKSTWDYAFNHFNKTEIERGALAHAISEYISKQDWPNISDATIKRDVSCFLRTYSHGSAREDGPETGLESQLVELGLIETLSRDRSRFVIGPKPTLSLGVFCYAVSKYWESHWNEANTISFEALTYGSGSPGKTYLLDENSMGTQLAALEAFTRGRYRWTETAGLRQLSRNGYMPMEQLFEFVRTDYTTPGAGEE